MKPGLTELERKEWTDLCIQLSNDVMVHQIPKVEKDMLFVRIDELHNKVDTITISEYFKLAVLERPKHLRHLPGDGWAANQRVLYVTTDYWTKTADERSWCNHGGVELEIVPE